MRHVLAVLVCSLLAVSFVTPAAARSAGEPCGWRDTAPSTYDHVVWVVLENHSYGDLIGAPGSPARTQSPYLNSLADGCGLATRYRALTHPSLPNYLAMVSGGTGGVTRDCTPAACPQYRRTVFSQVRASGRTWRVFAESMPTACRRTDASPYVARHNPPTYFPRLRGCASRDLPMGSMTAGPFLDAVDAGRLPALTVLVPNQCHNTHDCAVGVGDAWLSEVVPRILAGPDYAEGRTAVVVTWDEGRGGRAGQSCRRSYDESCHVATVLVAPSVAPGTRVSTRFDHYSLLRTTEQLLGLPATLGHAGDAGTRSMRAAFGL